METKFSLISYADEYRRQRAGQEGGQPVAQGHPESLQAREPWFEQLVEEIRTELTAPRGKLEAERQAYTETLNRAVLGFPLDRQYMMGIIQDLLARKRVPQRPPAYTRYSTLAEAVFAEVVGLNVLEPLLGKPDGLEEIQVVGEQIFEVRGGEAFPSAYRFSSIREVERIQQNLVLFNGATLNRSKRWAEVRLQDGSRVTMTGFGYTSVPTLTIRFYRTQVFDLDQLTAPEWETLTPLMARLLRAIVRARFNLVLIGSTNSGKTSLMKALIKEMPDTDRLVTIESRFELMISRDFPAKNVIEYEIDEEDERHDGNQAFKLALRQSPKRICHAEIRDEDANLYVRACTRGHEGSMTTVHVQTLEDAPETITDMCMMDKRGMDPVRLVRRITEYVTQIGLEMAIVGGKRKLVRIGEFEYAGDRAKVRDWVRYNFATRQWEYPLQVSEKAMNRFRRHDPEAAEWLEKERGGENLAVGGG